MHMRILPSKSRTLTYDMYPLIAGSVALPKLSVSMARYPGVAESIVEKIIPSSVYVKVIKIII